MKLNSTQAIILIICLTAIVYANSLGNSFVWDDFWVIVENNFIKSWKNLPLLFSRNYLTPDESLNCLGIHSIGSGEASYRPVSTFSCFLDYFFWKLNPFGYHLTNLILHIFNVLLLYAFFNLVTKNLKVSLLASLLFALHPVNSEAVSVISFREDLLAFFFFMAALILYLRLDEFSARKKPLFYFLSLVLFGLALFSKEMAATLPMVIILYDYFFTPPVGSLNMARRIKLRYLGYIIVFLFYIWVWGFLIGRSQPYRTKYLVRGIGTNLLTMPTVVANYIQWFILPVNVHPTLPDDPFLISRTISPRVIRSFLVIVLCLLAAFKSYRRNKLVSFSIFWFFITLLPVYNIFPLRNIMASRYLYLAIAGPCLLLSFVLFKLKEMHMLKIAPRVLEISARNIILIILFSYSLLTITRNFALSNNVTQSLEMIKIYPRSSLAHNALGFYFMKSGSWNKAMDEFRLAISLDPDAAENYNNLGICYYLTGKPEAAVTEYKRAIRADPQMLKAYTNLGAAYGSLGEHRRAIECFDRALKIDPQYLTAYDNKAVTLKIMGDAEAARKTWEKLLEIEPGYQKARENLNELKKLLAQ